MNSQIEQLVESRMSDQGLEEMKKLTESISKQKVVLGLDNFQEKMWVAKINMALSIRSTL